jgi:hypothetical protein
MMMLEAPNSQMIPGVFSDHKMLSYPPPPPQTFSRRRACVGEQATSGNQLQGKERHHQDQPQIEFMMQKFKTNPCRVQNNSPSHDHRCCPYFHGERDRRRPAFDNFGSMCYLGEPCAQRFDDERHCDAGELCQRCHSTAELLYHPDFFKKRLCHQFRRCPRGKYCAFAHARQELLVPHFTKLEETQPTEEFIANRFKTQWCPIGGAHDWESCVYAHTYRDWRRTPLVGYSSHPCPRWSLSIARGSPELDYGERCFFGVGCPMAHGAKEQLYHPNFYKTSPCSDPKCRRGPLCAFTHGDADKHTALTDEDVGKAASKKRLSQAELILSHHQPTYALPPMYHAIEESPKVGVTVNKTKRNKGKGPMGKHGNTGNKVARIPGLQPEMSFSTAPSLPLPQHFRHEVPMFQSPYPNFVGNIWMPMSPQSSVNSPMDGASMYWGQSPASGYVMGAPLPMSPTSDSNDGATSLAQVDGSPTSSSDHFLMPKVVNLSLWRQKDGYCEASGPPLHREDSTTWRTLSSFGSAPPSNGNSVTTTPRTKDVPEGSNSELLFPTALIDAH